VLPSNLKAPPAEWSQGADVETAGADVVRAAESIFPAPCLAKSHDGSVEQARARATVGGTAARELVGDEEQIFGRSEAVRHRDFAEIADFFAARLHFFRRGSDDDGNGDARRADTFGEIDAARRF
jgi:hypothetical protein